MAKEARNPDEGDFVLLTNEEHTAFVSACRAALEALRNVPVVGEVYDQQHSDTAMRAILKLQGVLVDG